MLLVLERHLLPRRRDRELHHAVGLLGPWSSTQTTSCTWFGGESAEHPSHKLHFHNHSQLFSTDNMDAARLRRIFGEKLADVANKEDILEVRAQLDDHEKRFMDIEQRF